MTFGEPLRRRRSGQVTADSAAAFGGMQVGDVITNIDGQQIARFEDVQQTVRLNPGSR